MQSLLSQCVFLNKLIHSQLGMLLPTLFMYAVMLIITVICAVFDLKTGKIPNSLVILNASSSIIGGFVFYPSIILLRVGFSIALLLILLAFRRFFKNKLGMGDIKLIASLSITLYAWGTWVCLFSACVFGLSFWFVSSIIRKKMYSSLPFAPFIALGVVVSFLFLVFDIHL